MKLILPVLACVFAGAHALVGTTCLENAQCDPGECCQILSEFQIVSKRDITTTTPGYPTSTMLTTTSQSEKTGTCQRYKTEGEYCNTLEQINGYCGCGPGLYCHMYQSPIGGTSPSPWPWTTTTGAAHVINTRTIPTPRPGFEWVSECERI